MGRPYKRKEQPCLTISQGSDAHGSRSHLFFPTRAKNLRPDVFVLDYWRPRSRRLGHESFSRGRSPKARQPSNRTVRPRLRRCGLPCYLQKMWYEITLYTFRGRKQEISRIQCVSFKGWLQCSTMPCISPIGSQIRERDT